MPGIYRLSIDQLILDASQCFDLGIPAIALFPVIDDEKKSLDAKESYNDKGLIPQAIKALKKALPLLGVITDIALDPYTSHGQDGLMDDQGTILNDATVEVLVKQAITHARSGSNIVATL